MRYRPLRSPTIGSALPVLALTRPEPLVPDIAVDSRVHVRLITLLL